MKNQSHQPIVLGVFHDTSENIGSSNYRNILPNVDFSPKEGITDYLKISPIQDFHKIDKDGNFELSSHTKSFIIGQETKFDEENFDYEDLSVKSPIDKSVIPSTGGYSGIISSYDITSQVTKNVSLQTIQVDEKYSKPKKYMAVFRDNFKDNATNWLRFIVDSSKTVFKIIKAQQKANKTTYLELDENGGTTVKRQLDTKTIKGNKTKIFTDIQVDANGTITIETIDQTTKIKTNTSTTHDIDSINSEANTAITTTTAQNNISSDSFVTETVVTKAEKPKNLEEAESTKSTSTVTINSAFVAPLTEDIELFNFPAQSKLKLVSLLNTTNSTIDSDSTVATTYTTPTTYTISSSTYTTSSTTDDSEDLSETAKTIITINPKGGSITIQTKSLLKIDALKGISMNSKDGATSISAKKGVKIESSEGYFYGKAKS